MPTRSDLIYNDDYTAYSLFRNLSIIIDRFRCSDRMDYCQYNRHTQSSKPNTRKWYSAFLSGEVASIRTGLGRHTYYGFACPSPKRHRTITILRVIPRDSLSRRIEAGTSFADQPRPRSLPSMSWQFAFVDYQWHRREWPRQSTRRSILRNLRSITLYIKNNNNIHTHLTK